MKAVIDLSIETSFSSISFAETNITCQFTQAKWMKQITRTLSTIPRLQHMWQSSVSTPGCTAEGARQV